MRCRHLTPQLVIATLRYAYPPASWCVFRSGGNWASGRPTGGYPDRDSPACVEIVSSVSAFDIVRLEGLVLDVSEFLCWFWGILGLLWISTGEIGKFSVFGIDASLFHEEEGKLCV